MERALAELLYSLPDAAVAATDLDHRFVLVSPRFVDLFGARLAESLEEFFHGLPLFEPSDAGDRPVPERMRPLARAQRGEMVRDLVYLALCADGERRFLRFNAAPRIDVNGAVAGAICLVQDVTAAYLQAQREREIRDQLIETINHHFRTPLSLVLGHAEILEDMALTLPAEAQRSVDALVRGAKRLHALTQAVSELVELTSATQLRIQTADIAHQLLLEISTLEPMAKARGLHVRRPRGEPLIVSGDVPLIRRAFAALLRNAIENAPKGTCVGVSLRRRDSWVELTVSDRGPGIPPEDIERLCHPFVTLDSSGAKRGLGLALAQTVARAHGGSLRMKENKGGGLKATIRVPLNSVVPLYQGHPDQVVFEDVVGSPGTGRRLRVV